MFERFTDQARRVVVLAQEEARLLNHPYIGSEHALLGVLAEGHGTGAHTLRSLDVSIEMVRAKVVALVGRGDRAPSGHIPFTPQAKRALEGALREALHAGDHEIGTEHLLLGLIREGDSTAARVLTELGLDPDAVRQRVADLRAGPGDVHIAHGPPPRGGMSASGVPFGPPWSACSFCGRDLWEVDHYVVGNGAVICDVCVATRPSPRSSRSWSSCCSPAPRATRPGLPGSKTANDSHRCKCRHGADTRASTSSTGSTGSGSSVPTWPRCASASASSADRA